MPVPCGRRASGSDMDLDALLLLHSPLKRYIHLLSGRGASGLVCKELVREMWP